MVSQANQTILQKSIKDFLDDNSVPRIRHCPECGCILLAHEAQFSLFGSEQVWDIPIPYCPLCDPVITESGGS